MSSRENEYALRHNLVTPTDCAVVRLILAETGFFRTDEVDVAVELLDERLTKGADSGYEFLFAEERGTVIGYACYGLIACTLGSFDLYWIAVTPHAQGQGVGQLLLSNVESEVERRQGRHIYIETSGREQYASTRAFYAKCGYEIVATIPSFYDEGDDKVIWRKVMLTASFPSNV
ncbi:MAG: GNAT family N-acetyltransferase [Planctomycetales bacterium]|nr:GNAT family N-acetyltransferase [Planctomycetales bacterium]